MFKKNDYIIISVICFFLGIFLVSQYYSGIEVLRVAQPENNEVLAIEVSKLTRSNAELRRETKDLTSTLDSYENSAQSSQKTYNQYLSDLDKFGIINGEKGATGQGIIINVSGNLSTPQLVDLVNAIKNIGSETLEINGKRVIINTEMSQFANQGHYEIKVLGNSKLLKTSMERKGGIVEQVGTKDVAFSIIESDKISIDTTSPIKFRYAKIVE